MADEFAAAKRAAARTAAAAVTSGMRLGLGTGSTVVQLLDALAERVKAEQLNFVGVPTSHDTAKRAARLGLSLTTLDEIDQLDVTIDGADEIDPQHNLIKGGGGALTREKIVAAASERMWVIASESKVVPHLGATFALPIEVLPFGIRQTERHIAASGLTPTLRLEGEQPFETDNGNRIVDCTFDSPVDDLPALQSRLSVIPGVVECGLFLGMANRVIVGRRDGSVFELG